MMTSEQKYAELLKELGEILMRKNDKISVLEWQVEDLKKKLAEIESDKVCAKRIGVEK